MLRLSAGREELQIQQLADPLDQVRSATDRDMAVETLNQHARSIQEIRAALARIEDGSYSICQRCEVQIASRPLDALPWASMCVHCQSAVELEAHQDFLEFHSAA